MTTHSLGDRPATRAAELHIAHQTELVVALDLLVDALRTQLTDACRERDIAATQLPDLVDAANRGRLRPRQPRMAALPLDALWPR